MSEYGLFSLSVFQMNEAVHTRAWCSDQPENVLRFVEFVGLDNVTNLGEFIVQAVLSRSRHTPKFFSLHILHVNFQPLLSSLREEEHVRVEVLEKATSDDRTSMGVCILL